MKLCSLRILSTLFLLVGLAPMTARAEAPFIMRLAAVQDEGLVYVKTLEAIAGEIGKKSEGRIEVRLLTGGVIGPEGEALRMQRQGKIQGGFTAAVTLTNALPAFRYLTLPLQFHDYDQIPPFLGSPLDLTLREPALELGLRVMGYGSYGRYGLLLRGSAFVDDETDEGGETPPPVLNAEGDIVPSAPPAPDWSQWRWDALAEKRVRVPKEDFLVALHRGLGLDPVTVPADQVAAALESGHLAAVAATPEALDRSGLIQPGDAFVPTRHLFGWSIFTLNERWFSTLPEDLRLLVEEVIARRLAAGLANARRKEEEILAAWQEAGVPVTIPIDAIPWESIKAGLGPLAMTSARRVERVVKNWGEIRRAWNERALPVEAVTEPASLEELMRQEEAAPGMTLAPAAPGRTP